MKWVIGVDEAGRGPLAGPITVSAFRTPANLRGKLIKILGGKIKDSKQFSEKRRIEIYKEFLKLRREGKILFYASHVSNIIIDRRGISKATKVGVKKSLNKLHHTFKLKKGNPSLTSLIKLDGLLKAPEEFKNQKTIIGGDSKDVFIACASIVAKVRRDRLMRRLAKKYPRYHLEIHKGYGTLLHRTLVKKYGLSKIHRKSFCKNLKI